MSDQPILDTRELAAGVGAASVGKYVARVLEQLDQQVPELDGLCRAGDLSELAGRCHKLKSSTRAIGAIAVADALTEVERVARAGQQLIAQPIVDTLPGLVEELRTRARELP